MIPYVSRHALDAARGIALLAAVGLGVGCGGAQAFDPRFPDNRPHDVERLMQRVSAAPATTPPPIAAGVTSSPSRLYAFDLGTRRVLWQTPLAATTAPVLAGETVVIQAEGELLVYDLRTGRRQFALDLRGMNIRGAAGEGDRVALVVGQGRGSRARAEAILVRGGTVAWRTPIPSQGGAPAIRGDTVLVPWSHQYLSALDAESGREYARIRVRDGVISHALTSGGAVFVGSHHSVAPLTPALATRGIAGADPFSLPAPSLPGRPLLLPDLYTSPRHAPPDSAQHRIALVWQPRSEGGDDVGLRDDTLYLVFYRFVFALDPASFEVRWVFRHDADIVGASAQLGGVAFADEAGHFGLLGAGRGQVVWQQSTDLPSTVAAVPPRGAGPHSPSAPPDPARVRTALFAAAQDPDARLVPARLFALERLAALPHPEATAHLIGLCDDAHLAPLVRDAACKALRDREQGVEHLMDALERHAGHLEGTTAPPVGALAKAAASQDFEEAVPLLVAHLRDPFTPSPDLAPVVAAIAELGDTSAAEPLSDFLRLYHADPIDEHLVAALQRIPQALVRLSGPVARPTLEQIASDGLSMQPVRARAQAALESIEALEVAANAEEREADAQAQAPRDAAEQAQEPEDTMPFRLTPQVVDKALLPVRDELQACLVSDDKAVFHARIVLVVENGEVLMVSVLPKKLQGCIEPLIRSQPFPETKLAKREQITYVLKRQPLAH